MKQTGLRFIPSVLMVGIILISGLLSSMMFTTGHNWGGDFAAYIMQAQSLLNGTVEEFIRRNSFTINQSEIIVGPVTYPWGFPILLAPVLSVWGLNLLALKLVNLTFYLLFLITAYFLLKRRLSSLDAACLVAIFAFHPALLSAQDAVLSDIPFLFFSTLGVLLIDETVTKDDVSARSCLQIGIVAFAAFEIRANGILLLATLFLCQVIRFSQQRGKPPWRNLFLYASLPYVVFFVLGTLLSILLPYKGSSYLEYLQLNGLPQLILRNGRYYLGVLASFFFIKGIGIILSPFALIGAVAQIKRDYPLLIHSFLTLTLYMAWPGRQGLRFLFPILLFVVYFIFQGLKLSGSWLDQVLWAKVKVVYFLIYFFVLGFVAVSCFLSIKNGQRNLVNQRRIEGPYTSHSAAMFNFIARETDSKSVVGFFKPRVMRLMSNRDSFAFTDCRQLDRIDYLVVYKLGPDYDLLTQAALAQCGLDHARLEIVFENTAFDVYEVYETH